MSLPYQPSFQGLRLVGLLTERCHVARDNLVRIYFQLSDQPPLGWAYLFANVWRSLAYHIKRETGVDGNALWIECIPEEIEPHHWPQLEYAVAQTNVLYQQQAQAQVQARQRERDLEAQLAAKLVRLRHVLYPTPEPEVAATTSLAQWFRRWFGGPPAPRRMTAAGARLVPAPHWRDYHHGRFDGAGFAPETGALSLDYSDHDPGGVRFCFRYVLSAHAAPKLLSGFLHEEARLAYEIPFARIPRQVIREAQAWLAAQSETSRSQPLCQAMAELARHLRAQEPSSAGPPGETVAR